MVRQTSWRVLVVEDDFRVAGIHAAIVEKQSHFEVAGTARSVAEARATIVRKSPDLILADVYLPDGDGIELARSTGLDTFVLSAANEPETFRRAVRAGVLAYLVKPFSRAALEERLDRYHRYKNVVSGTRGLTQEKIDRAMAILHGPGQTVPAGRSATEELLLEALGGGEYSASEAGQRAGVSRATAQRRLADLAARGMVTVRLRYGSSGRPEHLYKVSSASRS